MKLPFPDRTSIEDLFRLLLGKPISAKTLKDRTLDICEKSPMFAGIFADRSETVRAAILIEFAVAMGTSGALAAIPSNVVLKNCKDVQITPVLRANVAEILNIAGSLLNATGAPHLRLLRVEDISGPPQGEIERLIQAGGRRIDIEIGVPPCPAGRVTVLRHLA
jgi:hypothetical protein